MRWKDCFRWRAYERVSSGRVSERGRLGWRVAWARGTLGEEPDEELLLVDLALERLVGPLLEDGISRLGLGACLSSRCDGWDENELEEELVWLVGTSEVLEGDCARLVGGWELC